MARLATRQPELYWRAPHAGPVLFSRARARGALCFPRPARQNLCRQPDRL